MLKRKILSIFMILLLFPFSLLLSDIIIIDINGGDYTTIQEGINAATDGDTVLVYPGTYYENINYNGKNITVASLYLTTQNNSYIDSTVIDGNQNGSVVTFETIEDSTTVLCGFTIQNGSGTLVFYTWYMGGGIYIIDSNPTIQGCMVKDNITDSGAGLFCKNSNIHLNNVTICKNHAFSIGGGIYIRDNSTLNFNSINRCNMYENYAGNASELYSFDSPEINLIVDTFTVMQPTEDFITSYPNSSFTFNILNSKIEPVYHDLYVSPDGDNNNSGLSYNEPLKNISYALMKVASDSTNHNTIFLSNGIYSPSLTDERFSLNFRSYVSIIGENEENTILDGENLSKLIYLWRDNHFSIENLTIQNGTDEHGGGMKFYHDSNPTIKNVTFKNNTAFGGGALQCVSHCSPIFENVTIKNNSSEAGGGVWITENCNPTFINCIIDSNSTITPGWGFAGGVSCMMECNPIFINTVITNNVSDECSGLTASGGAGNYCDPTLINCTICGNSANPDGTIFQGDNSNISLINCILRNYSTQEIVFSTSAPPETVMVSYCNIDGGIDAINTNNNGTIIWGEGNIDSIPQFVGGDPFSYKLTEGSPCIDAGTLDTTGLNLPPTDLAGNPRIHNGRIDIGAYEWQGQGVEEPDTSFINKLYLFQNKPNPFSSSTTITFISADYERINDYKLSIYNARGQLIRTYNGKKHNFWVKTDIVWDGTDEDGNKVSTGVYFYKLEYGNNAVTRKMLILE